MLHSHCNNIGHTKETYFELHVYPEYFNEYKQKKGKEKVNATMQLSETPLDPNLEMQKAESWNQELSSIIQEEIVKYMKGKNTYELAGCATDFASNILNNKDFIFLRVTFHLKTFLN